MSDSPKPAAGWYKDAADVSQLRYWDGSAWTEDRKPLKAPKSKASPILFCAGLGVAAFFLLANLSVSATGYDCGTVMSPEVYSGRSASDFSSLDPTGALGSEFTGTATAVSSAQAVAQNAACDGVIASRKNFAIWTGIIVFAVGTGAVRLIRNSS